MPEPSDPLEPGAAPDANSAGEPPQGPTDSVANAGSVDAPPPDEPAPPAPPSDGLTPEPFVPPSFEPVPASAPPRSPAGADPQLELLDDVELDVTIELGRAEMYIEDVLRLGVGSVVELDKLAGDPVDIYVNQRLVARGEVLVLNQNFCVRVNGIVSGADDGDVRS